MEITHICHACLLIDTGDIAIATDPWFGSAYSGQWNVFPKPIDIQFVQKASSILVSHAHEDHLDEPTLRQLASGRALYYPYYWYGETVSYLRTLGFDKVFEVDSCKTMTLGKDLKATFVTVGQDSIIVFESGGEVIVNVNDALHSTEPFTIRRVTEGLNRRWPKIDAVFCGFGGASYYPNTFHLAEKADKDIARIREQMFVHNFCLIVQALHPKIGVPFAADFVLLSDAQRWINEARFCREKIARYYDDHFRLPGDNVAIKTMYPGDKLVHGEMHELSVYRRRLLNGRLDHLIEEQYGPEIEKLHQHSCSGSTCHDILEALSSRLVSQLKGMCLNRSLSFTIRFVDTDQPYCINVFIDKANRLRLEQSLAPSINTQFIIETYTSVFRSIFNHDWAGDVLIIGYGAEIQVKDVTVVHDGSIKMVIELLAAYPKVSAYMRTHPVRVSRYLLRNWGGLVDRITSKLIKRKRTLKMVKGDQWLTQRPEMVANLYGLPPNSSK